MKNLFRMIGIIALCAIFGFGMAACSDGGDDPTYSAVILHMNDAKLTSLFGLAVPTVNNPSFLTGTKEAAIAKVEAAIAAVDDSTVRFNDFDEGLSFNELKQFFMTDDEFNGTYESITEAQRIKTFNDLQANGFVVIACSSEGNRVLAAMKE